MRAHFEQWMRDAVTLSVTDTHGQVEDITPRGVLAIEVADKPGE